MILTTSLYGCELLYKITGQSIDFLENTQRYFARTVQGLDKRSPSESTVANIGLWSLIGYIDKCKLIFLGRLCNLTCNSIVKSIFCASITQTAHSSDITSSFLSVARKYNLQRYLNSYIEQGVFLPKDKWRKIVHDSIHIYEEQSWLYSVSLNSSMIRYMNIHCKLTYHVLWDRIFLYPRYRSILQFCLRISSRNILSKCCALCNKHAFDYDCHIILHCEKLLMERNKFFSYLIDTLNVDTYV